MFGFEVPGEHASLAIRSHQAGRHNRTQTWVTNPAYRARSDEWIVEPAKLVPKEKKTFLNSPVKSNNHHQNSLIQQAKIEVIALGGPDSEGQLVQETIKKMDQHDTCDKKIMWWTFQVNAS